MGAFLFAMRIMQEAVGRQGDVITTLDNAYQQPIILGNK
jgi:hypothetical protein